MSNYAKGAAKERQVKKIFEGRGWWVLRSPGSKSPLDLLALRFLPATESRPPRIILCAVQVKSRGRASPTQWNALAGGLFSWPVTWPEVQYELWTWQRRKCGKGGYPGYWLVRNGPGEEEVRREKAGQLAHPPEAPVSVHFPEMTIARLAQVQHPEQTASSASK